MCHFLTSEQMADAACYFERPASARQFMAKHCYGPC
jgi:hypothetical protein